MRTRQDGIDGFLDTHDWRKTHGRRMAALLLLAILAGLPACSTITRTAPEITYYTLEYDPPGENFRDPAPPSHTLRMERFTIAPDYDTDRIVYRDASFTRGAYANHRWHASPEQLVRSFLRRDLETAGIFQAVFHDAATLGASYGLSGTVEEFLELEEETGWEAVLTLSVTLVDRAPGNDPAQKILFQKRFSAREKADPKTPQAVAQAMSLALRGLSREITAAIKEATDRRSRP